MNFFWYAARGAGVVSLILLSAVFVLGIVTSVRWSSASLPRFVTAQLHRNLALLSLVFLGVHIVTAVVDPFTHLGWLAAVVPFSSTAMSKRSASRYSPWMSSRAAPRLPERSNPTPPRAKTPPS